MRSSNRPIARKRLLHLLGAAGGGLVLAGCGGDSSSAAVPAASASAALSSSSCAVTPEGEIGPYFADDSAAGFNRTDILANLDGSSAQAGVPLTLNVYVRDGEKSCAAVAAAQVDIWHCNAAGVYSDEPSESTTGQT